MKTLYESIKSNIGIGRYREGVKMIEDCIPCTIVKNDGKQVWLLSDIFIGTKEGKIAFISNEQLDWTCSAYYEWGYYGCDKSYFPKGWDYPLADDWKDLGKELNDYIMKDCHMIPAYMVWMKKGKKLLPYDISTHYLYHDDRKCGIRFAKILKIK